MSNHLLCHQDASTDIDRKSVINHILCNFLNGVDTVHVTISCIVDQNIDPSVSFKDFRIDFLYGSFFGNVTFQNHIVGIHFL